MKTTKVIKFTCPGCHFYLRSTGACMYTGPNGCINAYPEKKAGKIRVILPDDSCSIKECNFNNEGRCTLPPGKYSPEMKC